MDVYRIAPLSAPIDAFVDVPGSKSIANRALVCAALADGESVLTVVPDGDDTEAMLDCLRLLGLEVDRVGTEARIGGGLRRLRKGPITLPTRLAGTTSRFLTALAALGPGPYTIDGEGPLRRRPMAPLHQALADMGVRVQSREAEGHLPVTVQGPGDVTVDEVQLRGVLELVQQLVVLCCVTRTQQSTETDLNGGSIGTNSVPPQPAAAVTRTRGPFLSHRRRQPCGRKSPQT